MAGGDAIRAMRADASRYVRGRKRLKVSKINKAMTISFPRTKVLSELAWTMRVDGSPVPMADYPARQVRKGVSVEINRGSRKLVASAFFATMRSGHRGIFRRSGKARLPIHELFSSTVVAPFNDNGMIPATFRRTSEVFSKSFARLLPLEIAKSK